MCIKQKLWRKLFGDREIMKLGNVIHRNLKCENQSCAQGKPLVWPFFFLFCWIICCHYQYFWVRDQLLYCCLLVIFIIHQKSLVLFDLQYQFLINSIFSRLWVHNFDIWVSTIEWGLVPFFFWLSVSHSYLHTTQC